MSCQTLAEAPFQEPRLCVRKRGEMCDWVVRFGRVTDCKIPGYRLAAAGAARGRPGGASHPG